MIKMTATIPSGHECNDDQSSTTAATHIKWYAVRVRSRFEKKVHLQLEKAGIQASLPLITTTQKWSDRQKKVELPLFKGYVFVKIEQNMDRLVVLQSPGVVNFVGINGREIPIPEEQLYWLNLVLNHKNILPQSEYPEGLPVRVVSGPLVGLEGTVIKKKAHSRLVVWFDSIMQGIAIDIDPCMLKPLKSQNLVVVD